ncbi:MAG: DUF362 domain-containing protein [Bryobacterales bacterium]|nr:DUF362 domain-containing protein [Bryobacterales bacterium]
MLLSRRAFLAGSAAVRVPQPYFDLHPFIREHPKAVFIRRTHVRSKMDGAAKLGEGLALSREIFVPSSKPGIPVGHRIVLKPNNCAVTDKQRPAEENWGTGTDPQFYEGLVLGLKELGVRQFHFIEANNYHLWNLRGWVDINERLGIHMNEPDRRARDFREGRGMTWSEVPDPVVFRRIPHFAPVNEPGTWLLNIAKWKGSEMCLSQTAKNAQGLVVLPYVRFCHGWKMVTGVPPFMKADIHRRAEGLLNRFFQQHRRAGYARYDAPCAFTPMHQEIWAQKTCDNLSVLKTGLAMLEGIYARDGNGFRAGNDVLANLVIFGRDLFRVDVIGLYLGGHEPGNVNLPRIARERGLTDTFNPWEIPIYEWTAGGPVARKLTDFERVPLPTPYLPLAGEPEMHLVNEPFDYGRHR